MGIKVADAQGAIDKSVNTIKVVDAQGAIDKEVQSAFVADAQGAIDKKFYENWVYHTGAILIASAGGGSTGTVTSSALSDYVKPVSIIVSASIKAFTLEGGTHVVAKLEIEYLNESGSWVDLSYTTKTAYDSYVTISISKNVTSEFLTKQLRYKLSIVGGDTDLIRQSIYGNCTAWYQKG